MGCIHDYDIDSRNVGTCKKCGRVMQFSFDGKSPPVVLKEGNSGTSEQTNNFHAIVSKPQENITNNITKNPQSEANKTRVTPEKTEILVPPRPEKKRELWDYFDANKDKILQDYYSMDGVEFREKWGMATGTWMKMKRRWNLKNKINRKSKSDSQVKPSETKFTQPSYSELASEVRYLRGWKECSIAFIEALKR